MITAEEWDRLFERLVPIVSIGVGSLSVGLATMALMRASPFGQRVYSQNGRYLVSVRYDDWHDLREFVTPNDPAVQDVYQAVGPNMWALYDWVCSEVDYRIDWGEFFQWPSETIATRRGDCEDTSILLTSLIRAGGTRNCHVALGCLGGYGHAWCQLNREILETTYTSARPVPDPQDYCPYVCFNDQEVLELWPGALGEVFGLRRNEELKLGLMAKVLEAVA